MDVQKACRVMDLMLSPDSIHRDLSYNLQLCNGGDDDDMQDPGLVTDDNDDDDVDNVGDATVVVGAAAASAVAPFAMAAVFGPAEAMVPVVPPVYSVEWTEDEIDFVGQWCKKKIEETHCKRNIVARCLKFILSDSSLISIFHPHHIVNSARLYYGYKAFNARNV